MKTRNTGHALGKLPTDAGLLTHSNDQNDFQFQDFEDSQTPHFATRQMDVNLSCKAPLANSYNGKGMKPRKGSKSRAQPSKDLKVSTFDFNQRRKASRQRLPSKGKISISSEYQEDAHRKQFKEPTSRNDYGSLTTGATHVPVGAAKIFKSTIFQKANNASDYLTCESTDEDHARSSLERPMHGFAKPEAFQYSHMSDNAFYKQQQWPQGSLAYSVSDMTNRRIDTEILKEETKAILLSYMDPEKKHRGLEGQTISSSFITKFGLDIPKKEQMLSFMESRCSLATDPQDLYELILIATDKIQFVIKTIQQNDLDLALEEIVDQAINLAVLEFKILLREKKRMQSMRSNGDSIQNLFRESHLQAADPTLLTDLDTLGSNLNDLRVEAKVFKKKENKKIAELHKTIDKLEKEEEENDYVPQRESKRTNSTSQRPTSPCAYTYQGRVKDLRYQLKQKYMKAWCLYVSMQKQSRKEKKYQESQVKATLKRANLLRKQKVVQVLYLNKLQQVRFKKLTKKIQQKRNSNLERRAFILIVKKFKRRQQLKEIKQVVNRYRDRRLAKNCVKAWNRVVFSIRHQQLTMFQQAIMKARYAPELLLEKLAAPYFLENLSSNDKYSILTFHALVHTQFRLPDKRLETIEINSNSGRRHLTPGPIRLRKHNVALFQRCIEHILQYKQLRVINALKANVVIQKKFRSNKRKRILTQVLQHLSNNTDLKKQLRRISRKSNLRIQSRIFNLLRGLIAEQVNMRTKMATLQKKHKQYEESRHFAAWKNIFMYYYNIEYGQTKIDTAEADVVYLNKYYLAIKQYYLLRKAKKPKQLMVKQFYLRKRTGIIFQTLLQFKNKKTRDRNLTQKIRQIHEQNLKQKYLETFVRTHFLVTQSRIMYQTRLCQCVLDSLKKATVYRQIKLKINFMARQKYCGDLFKKVFESLKINKAQRLEFKAVVIGYQVGYSKTIMSKTFKELKYHADKTKAKRMQLKYIDRLNTGNTIQKCFENWSLYAKRKRRIRHAFLHIQLHREQKIKQQYLIHMLIVFNRNKLSQQLYHQVSTKHNDRVIKMAFNKWFRRSRKLKRAEKIYTEMRQVTTRQDLFNLWRFKFLRKQQTQSKMQFLAQKRQVRLMRETLNGLKVAARDQVHRREMKKLCSFIFLKNLMKKSLRGLERNRHYRVTKRNVPIMYSNKIKFTTYYIMKSKWSREKPAIDKMRIKRNKMKLEIFNHLKNRWTYQKQVRANILALLITKDQTLSTQCFRAIKKWKYRKRELVRKNLPVYFLDEEHFKASFVWKFWKQYHNKQMRLKRSQEILEQQRREKSIKEYMNWWRLQLCQKVNWQYKAIPFHENVVQSNIKQQVVCALFDYKEQKRQKKEIHRKAFEFYRFQLLLKSTELLKQYCKKKQDYRQKIEFITLMRHKNVKREFLILINEKMERRVLYNDRYRLLQARSQQNKKQQFFLLWYKTYYKQQQIKPTMQLVTKFYGKTLMRRCLKRLYNYRTVSMLKKNMQCTADNYFQQNLVKKVFEHFMVRTYRFKTKNAMKKLADIHYKRNIILKWIALTNQRQRTRKSIENYEMSPLSNKRNQETINQLRTIYSNMSDDNKSILSDRKTTFRDTKSMRSAAKIPYNNLDNKSVLSGKRSNLDPSRSILSGNRSNVGTLNRSQLILEEDIQVDELNSTSEIMEAHEMVESKLNMLSNNILSQISSPSLATQRSITRQVNPRKIHLQNLMLQLKERYTVVKEQKQQQEMERTQRLLSKTQSRVVSQRELEDQADQIYGRNLMKAAYQILQTYTQTKLAKYDKQVQARTQYNICLKQKAFKQLRQQSRKYAQDREAIELFQMVRGQNMKKRVLMELRHSQGKQFLKGFQQEIAETQYRKYRLQSIFNALRAKAYNSLIADSLKEQIQSQKKIRYFKLWLKVTNKVMSERIKKKHKGL